MGTRIIEFDIVPTGILAAFTGSSYEVGPCVTSISKLKDALQQPGALDAIALAENGAAKALEIVTAARFLGKVPLILFQDETKTCDLWQKTQAYRAIRPAAIHDFKLTKNKLPPPPSGNGDPG